MAASSAESRRDGRRTDTRQRIVETALHQFATRGFAQSSLRSIAEELGITKAALYYHFRTKEELARSVFQPFLGEVDALLDRLDGSQSPRAVLTAYAEALAPHRLALSAMLRDPGAATDLNLAEVSQRWLSRLAALVAPAATPEDRVRVTVAFGGLTRALQLPETADPAVRRVAVSSALASLGR